ncbi:MAG TPA: isoprenylcysteine carboxyl methyltransferase [Deltaproteobacteria bacterium]|jgi:protein-S-isoprenylcysteine O-methyltransferase Ste14|nr:isoprenylcysteine carboxyl methyltransferase [Deltaproteobacteria bacterium]
MAFGALALYVLFALLAFGWRAWLQFQQTGDHGFRGLSGPFLSSAGVAGFLLSAGGITALLAPLAELFWRGRVGTAPLPTSVRGFGLALMALGIVVTLVAQIEMGASWRVGVDPSERTELVTKGLFAWVRNPIYTAMLTTLLGLVLVVPNILAAVAFFVAFVALELHVRKVEEPYLSRLHPEQFRAYARRVGRFIPQVGRIA